MQVKGLRVFNVPSNSFEDADMISCVVVGCRCCHRPVSFTERCLCPF